MELANKKQLDPHIANAFGVITDISLLPGGIDLKIFRSGDVVLRNLGSESQEAGNWNAKLFDRIKQKWI